MKPTNSLVLITGILLITASCKKDKDGSGGVTSPTPNVYVFGYDGDTLKYWKNGISNILFSNYINAMFVSGSDIYFAGGTTNTLTGGTPEYWKNGAATVLPDSGAASSTLNAVFVSGTDVYVAGSAYYNPTSTVPYTTPDAVYPKAGNWPMYWKNGVPAFLQGASYIGLAGGNGNAIREEFVTGMYVAGTDVYVAGGSHSYQAGVPSTYQFARYWKNGVPTSLTNGLVYAGFSGSLSYPNATGIFVSGTDVYVSGWQLNGSTLGQTALYWKNGTAHFLTDSVSGSSADAICVSGNDVYISGYQNINGVSYATYWKNGVANTLTTGTGGSEGLAITVSGNDVYVAGWENINNVSVARYWKNGVAVNLSNKTNRAAARAIFVQ